jgi:hypothetical protein
MHMRHWKFLTARHSLYFILIITGAVIIGVDAMDTVWNLSPLIAAFVFSETIIYAGGNKWSTLSPTLRYTSAGIITGTVIFPLFYHIAWAFNIVGAKIGSLPYAVFWFMPFCASAAGIIGGLTGFLIGNHKRTNDGAEKQRRTG